MPSSFGEKSVMRGKSAVVGGWRALFVEVIAAGTPVHSSGPIYDAEGRRIGTFNSIWRHDPDGTWLVVFDKGCPVCNCGRGP